jgi:hypothetical protein
MPTEVSAIPLSLIFQRAEQVLQTYEDNIILGDIVYDFLAREMNETSGQCFQNFLRYPLLSEDTLVTLSPTSSSSGCIASPSTTYVHFGTFSETI